MPINMGSGEQIMSKQLNIFFDEIKYLSDKDNSVHVIRLCF